MLEPDYVRNARLIIAKWERERASGAKPQPVAFAEAVEQQRSLERDDEPDAGIPHFDVLMMRFEEKLTLAETSRRIDRSAGTARKCEREALRYLARHRMQTGGVDLMLAGFSYSATMLAMECATGHCGQLVTEEDKLPNSRVQRLAELALKQQEWWERNKAEWRKHSKIPWWFRDMSAER